MFQTQAEDVAVRQLLSILQDHISLNAGEEFFDTEDALWQALHTASVSAPTHDIDPALRSPGQATDNVDPALISPEVITGNNGSALNSPGGNYPDTDATPIFSGEVVMGGMDDVAAEQKDPAASLLQMKQKQDQDLSEQQRKHEQERQARRKQAQAEMAELNEAHQRALNSQKQELERQREAHHRHIESQIQELGRQKEAQNQALDSHRQDVERQMKAHQQELESYRQEVERQKEAHQQDLESHRQEMERQKAEMKRSTIRVARDAIDSKLDIIREQSAPWKTQVCCA